LPGLHLIYSKSSLELNEKIQKDLDSLLHDKAYLKEIIHSDNNTILAATRYPEYPIHIWNTDRHLICFEGYIYNKENTLVESELTDIARKYLTPAEVDVGKIRDWVLAQDGDFNVVIFDKELKKWLFFNDVLGRLPVYFSDDNNRVILTREISFAKSQAVNLRLSKTAVAQYLLVGFNLGGDTLFSGIKRLPPSTLLVVDCRSNTIDQKIL